MFHTHRQLSLCFVAVFLLHSLLIFGQKPKNIILYIGDGYGITAKSMARFALGQGQPGSRYSDDENFHLLNADRLAYSGTLTTHSLNSWITDSAPGSTVYACGKKGKVHNEAVAFNMDANMPIETILEAAKKEGYAVGLVTTTRITHATPADFSTHTWNRDLENELAAQLISTSQAEYAAIYGGAYDSAGRHWVLPEPKVGVEIDVLLGGGARHFLPKAPTGTNGNVLDAKGQAISDKSGNIKVLKGGRADQIDLIAIAKQRGFTYVNSREALLALPLDQFKPHTSVKLLGLFHSSHLSYEQDRQTTNPQEPTLAEMTEIAIEILKRKGGSKGFFLMVEGGRIDHLEHANAGGLVAKDGRFHLGCDHEIASPDDVAAASKTNSDSGQYGSDYLIKEVLAFDYALGKGRAFLRDTGRQTLIFSTSDHECGGLAAIALHDEADQQKNGTRVRTYAEGPAQDMASGNSTSINPKGLTPGAAWFPEYEMYQFQGYNWPQPKSDTARRIVLSYGSNPLVNGNTNEINQYPGNHTPQDVWVGAEDNLRGVWAQNIVGRGQLDNTDLTPIMKNFLELHAFTVWDPKLALGITQTCKSQAGVFTISVTNQDPYPTEQVKIDLIISGQVVHQQSKIGVLRNEAKIQSWHIPRLEAGKTAQLSLTVLPTNKQQISISAQSAQPNTAAVKRVAADMRPADCLGTTKMPSELIALPYAKGAKKVKLSYRAALMADAQLSVYDVSGNRISTEKVKLKAGANTLSLKTQNWEKGQYTACLISKQDICEILTLLIE
jgi:alkaline phosphatase